MDRNGGIMRGMNGQGIRLSTAVCTAALVLFACGFASAVDFEEMAVTAFAQAPAGPSSVVGEATSALDQLLFVGTSNNSNVPTGTGNDVFTVDPLSSTAVSLLTGYQVWGATADVANERVLFTRASGLTPPTGQIGGGDELFAVPYAGGTPISLGRITVGGEGFRVDGLAISGGVLYGVNAGGGVDNGFYTIDWGTLVATNVSLHTDSISGLDADPDTGVIYGVNDTAGQLVTIATDGTITNLAAYPAGFSDIDGIGVGGGYAYLVTDEGGTFPVYDIVGGVYGTALTSPFTTADVFSGGAFAVSGSGAIFSDGFEGGNTDAWSSVLP